MDVRKFRWADLPQLAQLINLTASEASRRTTGALLAEDLGRPGLSPEDNCMLFEAEGELRAVCLIHPEPSIERSVLQAWIHPEHGEGDLERMIVRTAITHASSLGSRVLHFCAPPSGFWPDLLKQEGLTHTRTYWLMRWRQPQVPSNEMPRGYTLLSYQPEYAGPLTDIQNAAFGGHWGFCPNTVEEIAYRAKMSISPPEGIVLLKDGTTTAGYCWTCTLGQAPHSVGIISMIGIGPTYRCQGLSKPVLLAGMSYLLAHGVEYIQLDVDSENTPAVKLYRSVGFDTASELHWFEASLSPSSGLSTASTPL